jgi:hypothetical protein
MSSCSHVSPLSNAGFDAMAFVGLGFGVATADGGDADEQAEAHKQLLEHGKSPSPAACREKLFLTLPPPEKERLKSVAPRVTSSACT